MKFLIMCEGPNELKIVNMLLDSDKLIISKDDLIDMRPFHARQLTSTQLKPVFDMYTDKFVIYRIGDKMSEKLIIPKELKERITDVKKICTKPELEILLIISAGLLDQFNKVKSAQKPKDFCKHFIEFNGMKYDNSSAFYEHYFFNIDLLVDSIKEYYRTHKAHKKDEGYLFDLLRDKDF